MTARPSLASSVGAQPRLLLQPLAAWPRSCPCFAISPQSEDDDEEEEDSEEEGESPEGGKKRLAKAGGDGAPKGGQPKDAAEHPQECKQQ